MPPYFFGYGSLVNRATHTYPGAQKAHLSGWRRAWVRTDNRDVVFLTAVPDAGAEIDGLIAAVPNSDWAALDAREYGYARVDSAGRVRQPLTPAPAIAHYAIPLENTFATGEHVILLSYLDVVCQGFLNEFGQDGLARFFETTTGWDTPILNDREAPRYPRAQVLAPAEVALVDQHLTALSAQIR